MEVKSAVRVRRALRDFAPPPAHHPHGAGLLTASRVEGLSWQGCQRKQIWAGQPIFATPKAGRTLTGIDVDDLGGLLEVQEEGQATLLLLVMQGRNPVYGLLPAANLFLLTFSRLLSYIRPSMGAYARALMVNPLSRSLSHQVLNGTQGFSGFPAVGSNRSSSALGCSFSGNR